jgi:hypothetical protein
MGDRVLEVLIAAKKVIEKPSKWTRTWLARDESGEPVSPNSADAVCFCAVGAIRKVIDEEIGLSKIGGEVVDALDRASMSMYRHDITSANDRTDHAGIHEIFDVAISNHEWVVAQRKKRETANV